MGKLKGDNECPGRAHAQKDPRGPYIYIRAEVLGKITNNNQKTKAANLETRGVSDFHGYYISKFECSVFREKTYTYML